MRFLLPLAVLATACSENGLHDLNDAGGPNGPMIELVPDRIEFGELSKGEVQIERFLANSVGQGDLLVERWELFSAGSFTLVTPDDELPTLMPPGSSAEVEVAFSPVGSSGQSGEVWAHSDAEGLPVAIVELAGAGAVPELQIDPAPYDMGDTYVGCPLPGEVTLRNVGSDLLEIYDVSWSGDHFVLDNQHPLPLQLGPGEEVGIPTQFAPDYDDEYTGLITVTSNEPLGVRTGDLLGTGKYAGEYLDRFEVPVDPPSDIIFSVDQSCSMDDDSARLASNFNLFISQLSSYTSDWQVMVVNNDNGCNSSGILTPSTPGYENSFSSAAQSGGGSYTEKLLTVADKAVDNTDPGECNYGFMRSTALLHVIMVSDEPEQSSGFWRDYVDRVIAKKGSASLVKYSAIAGDYPGGCSTAAAGTGYYDAALYTHGEFLSICSTSWSSYMSALAQASIVEDTYELSATPVASSIEVFVDGVLAPSSWWTYNSGTNSVQFVSNVPEGGQIIEITYGGRANCD